LTKVFSRGQDEAEMVLGREGKNQERVVRGTAE